MPSWGRPSRARKRRKDKGRGRYPEERNQDRRFQEVDSDEDDGQGVGLDAPFINDQFYSSKADPGHHRRDRQPSSHGDTSESSEDGRGPSKDRATNNMQLALRDKEELLVQNALERIQRAKMLGKTNVELTRPELDALERKTQKDHNARRRKGSNELPTDNRRDIGISSETVNSLKSGRRRIMSLFAAPSQSKPLRPETGPPLNPTARTEQGSVAPRPLSRHAAVDLRGSYRQLSRPSSRSVSSHSPQHHTPSPPLIPNRTPQTRYFSIPEASRSTSLSQPQSSPRHLPDDPNWIPQSRYVPYDQLYPPSGLQHQSNPHPLSEATPRYTYNRRNVSDPSTSHSAIMDDYHSRPHNTSPRPFSQQREFSSKQDWGYHEHKEYSEDDDDDDDGNYGVQLDAPSNDNYGARVRPDNFTRSRHWRGE